MKGKQIAIGLKEQTLIGEAQRVAAEGIGRAIPRFRGCSVSFELKPSQTWRVNVYKGGNRFTPEEQTQAETIVKEARKPLEHIMRGAPTKAPSVQGSYKVMSRSYGWKYTLIYNAVVKEASRRVGEELPRLKGCSVLPTFEYFFPYGMQVRMRILFRKTILTPERLSAKMIKRLSEKWHIEFQPQALSEEELALCEDIFEEEVEPFLKFTGHQLHRDTERGEWEDAEEEEE